MGKIILILIGLSFIILIVLLFLRPFFIKEKFNKMERTDIKECSDSKNVKISGSIIHNGNSVINPISECTVQYYLIKVYEYVRDINIDGGAKGGGGWVEIISESVGNEIFIEQDNYIALVSLKSAVLLLDRDSETKYSAKKCMPEKERRFISKHISGRFNGDGEPLNKLKISIVSFQAGDNLTVMGKGRWASQDTLPLIPFDLDKEIENIFEFDNTDKKVYVTNSQSV